MPPAFYRVIPNCLQGIYLLVLLWEEFHVTESDNNIFDLV